MWKLKVTPTSVFAFRCYDGKRTKDLNFRKRDVSSSDLSVNSSRKMKRAIQWLIACSEVKQVWEKKFQSMVNYRVNHCTLTFHENLKDDKLARNILSSWLEVAKYRWDVQQYVWKAEPQERGAIHFHLTTNRYMPHEEVRFTWNRALRKHKLANITDNSIDVHAVLEEQDLLKYFSDYLTDKEKHEGRRKIKGRLWGCSQDLSSAGSDYIALDDQEVDALEAEFSKHSLQRIIKAEGKEIPDFLRSVSFWCLSPSEAGGEISELYQRQLSSLKVAPRIKNLSLWPEDLRAAEPCGLASLGLGIRK